MEKKFCTAVILAAGQGKRMGTKVAKQYLEISGRPLLYYTLRAFERSPLIDSIVLLSLIHISAVFTDRFACDICGSFRDSWLLIRNLDKWAAWYYCIT